MLPRALIVPPGIPDFMSRVRFVTPSRQVLSCRAWSGCAPITKVDVSVDGGLSWAEADLGDPPSAFAWRPWSYGWDSTNPGEYELTVRGTDVAVNVQPTDRNW